MSGLHGKLTAGAKGTNQSGKIAQFENEMQANIQQPGQRLNPELDKVGNEFPARFVPKDEYDNKFAVKMEQLQQDTNMYGKNPQVHMTIDKEDIDYIERKRATSNYLVWRQWLKSTIDFSDPVQGKDKHTSNTSAALQAKRARKNNAKSKSKKPTKAIKKPKSKQK